MTRALSTRSASIRGLSPFLIGVGLLLAGCAGGAESPQAGAQAGAGHGGGQAGANMAAGGFTATGGSTAIGGHTASASAGNDGGQSMTNGGAPDTGGKAGSTPGSGGSSPVVPPPLRDPFDVVTAGAPVDIYVDAADFPAVVRATGDLRADVQRVALVAPVIKNSTTGLSTTAIMVGTLGKSPAIDALVAAGKLDTAGVTGKWESAVIQTVPNPVAG